MAEEVIVDIKIDSEQSDDKIKSITKEIVDLQKANSDLNKTNKELAKTGQQNSKEYVDNANKIALNKQKISENTATRKGLIQTLVAEDDAIKALRVQNAELIRQRDLISTSTEEGRSKIAQYNDQIDKNNETIRENVSELEQQKINIGNYASALDGALPGLGKFANNLENASEKSGSVSGGLKAMTSSIGNTITASLKFIATPLGFTLTAIATALIAVKTAFTSSEEGQNKYAKITSVINALLGNLVDLLADVGEKIIDAFENPKETLEAFGNFIRDQIVNRIVGLAELIPNIGKSISLLLKGEFSEAGKVATDAIGKIVIGVENLTDKVNDSIDSVKEFIKENINEGNAAARVAEQRARADQIERKLIVDRAKLESDIAELRLKAREEDQYTAEQRRDFLIEARKLQDDLLGREKEVLVLRRDAQILENTFSRTNIENKNKEAQAIADVSRKETERFNQARQIQRELIRIDNELIREREDEEKRQTSASNDLQQLRIEQEVKYAESIEERVEKQIELENLKREQLLDNESLLEVERQLIIAESEATITDIVNKGVDDRLDLVRKRLKQEEDLRKKDLAAQEKIENLKVKATVGGLNIITKEKTSARFAGNAIFQQDAIKETFINTRAAAVAAYKALAPIPYIGPVLGAAAAGAAILYGGAQLAAITGITFARGGLIGKAKRGAITKSGGLLNGPSHANGGIPFSVGGRLGFEAEGGEAIINRRSTAMFRGQLSAINQAGGGVAFATGGITGQETRIASRQADQQLDVNRLAGIINRVQPVLVYEDFETKQADINTVRNRVKVIE